MFRHPMFGVFEVQYFGVCSKTSSKLEFNILKKEINNDVTIKNGLLVRSHATLLLHEFLKVSLIRDHLRTK